MGVGLYISINMYIFTYVYIWECLDGSGPMGVGKYIYICVNICKYIYICMCI